MFSPLEFILKWLDLLLSHGMRSNKLFWFGWPYSKWIDLHVLLALLLHESFPSAVTRFTKRLHWPRFRIKRIHFALFDHLVHCHIHEVLSLILPTSRLRSVNRPSRLVQCWAVRTISANEIVVMSATSLRPKLLSLSLLNAVILYYEICFLILNITALEARIDLRKLALVWVEGTLLVWHAELIV